MLKYKDLTSEQKKFICNGCGSKGGIVKVPNFIFKASCNHHDFRYWLGYNEEHRLLADEAFYKKMLEDIKSAKWYLKPHYHLWAYAYYKSVRLGGKKAFYSSFKFKNIDDLKAEMMLEALKQDSKNIKD